MGSSHKNDTVRENAVNELDLMNNCLCMWCLFRQLPCQVSDEDGGLHEELG